MKGLGLRAASLSAEEGDTGELAPQHPGGGSGKHAESDDFEVVACVQFFKITRVNISHCPRKFSGQEENT